MNELQELRNLREAVHQLRLTPPVDDDFPEKLGGVDLHLHRSQQVAGEQFCLIEHLKRQKQFSLETFGPGQRTAGVVDHIRKELVEIEQNPNDPEEWVDVLMLTLDGLWRAGLSAEQIIEQIKRKQEVNEMRDWPDWRTADPNKAIEHVRS